MFCGKTDIPLGANVRIIANSEGNLDEPFLDLTGKATNPFVRGCRQSGWIGVILDSETIYGSKFNFHIEEIQIEK
jgi:hypothetical protein